MHEVIQKATEKSAQRHMHIKPHWPNSLLVSKPQASRLQEQEQKARNSPLDTWLVA